jgi:SNF2 family DNA or RNA helicase
MDGFSSLNDYQREVVGECLCMESMGLCLPLGAGKTRTSLVLANEVTPPNENILVVASSKNLISQWVSEIRTVFGDVGVYVYHREYDKDYLQRRELTQRFVITVPQLVRKFYSLNSQIGRDYNLKNWLVWREIRNEGAFGQHEVINYRRGPEPIPSEDLIFSRRWGCLIIDEFHLLLNITSEQCQGILCIPARRCCMLTGTAFDNPDEEHLLAYYTRLNTDPDFPSSLPDSRDYIRGKNKNGPKFEGVRPTMVFRDKTPVVIEHEIHEVIVPLKVEEQTIYLALRSIVLDLIQTMNETPEHLQDKRKLSSALLSMITMLRQCAVCPMIPVAKMALNVCTNGDVDPVAEKFFERVDELEITDYLNDEASVVSSRMQKALEIIGSSNKTVVFTCHRSIIELMKAVCVDTPVYDFESSLSGPKRDAMLDELRGLDRFVLFMTFRIGSTGLNLFFADTGIIFDVDWMESSVVQAMGRLIRQGQTQKVNMHYLMSNTGIEDAVFKKQLNKRTIISELMTGVITSARDNFHVKDIIRLLEQDVVTEKARQLYTR